MNENQIKNNVEELIALVTAGNWETAFNKFYHDQLEKTDLDGKTVNGKEANLALGKEFAAKVDNIRDYSSPGYIVKGTRSFIVWSFDFDVSGEPFKVVEIAIQDWEEGKIKMEKFIA